jgi:methylthioribose-1-phosphate isomerase
MNRKAHFLTKSTTALRLPIAKDIQLAPDECSVSNYAFDVTPNELVTAIITEKGVARAPYAENLRRQFEE